MAKSAPKAAQPQQDPETQAIFDAVKGHSTIELAIEGGKTYKLAYPRAVIKKMERNGFSVDNMGDFASSSYTEVEKLIDEFVKPAFETYQPGIKLEEVLDVWEQVPDKEQMFQYLIALYMQPTLAIVTNPTQTRAKFTLI